MYQGVWSLGHWRRKGVKIEDFNWNVLFTYDKY